MRQIRVVAPTLGRAASGVVAGAAGWFSLGVIAIDGAQVPHQSFGLLPPIWLLAVMAITGASMAAAFKRPSTAMLCATGVLILPWIAPPIPALMLWTRPASILIWCLVAADALRPRMPTRFLSSKAAVTIAAALVFSSIALLGDPRRVTGDEPHYLIVTSSLLIDGDVDLANDYDLGRHQGFYSGSLEPRHAVLMPSGRQYPFHGLGTSLLVLPGFAAAGAIGAHLVIAVLGVVGLTLLWDAVLLVTRSTAAAWSAIAVLLLSIPFAGQMGAIYPDPPAAFAVCLALWTLIRIELRASIGPWTLFLTGLGLATLPWYHVRMAPLALTFGLALLAACWRLESPRRFLVAFLTAPVLGAIAWLASFAILFDTLNPTVLFATKAAGSLAPLPAGALGLLWDQQYGLLVYAPALAFAAAGFRALARRSPLTAWSSVAAFLITFVVAALFDWWGGFTTPGRFLVPALPALALLVGTWYAVASAHGKSVFLALVVFGASLLGIAASADRGQLIRNAPNGRATIFDWLSSTVDLPAALPSLLRPDASFSGELVGVASWLLVGIVVISIAWLTLRAFPRSDPFAITACAIVAWLSGGTALGWSLRGANPSNPDRSQMALLHASGSDWLTTGLSRAHFLVPREAIVETIRVSAPGSDPSTLLHIPWVPPGRYRVEVTHDAADDNGAALSLEAGRDAWPMWRWNGDRAAEAPEFALVVPVHSLSLRSAEPPAKSAKARLLVGPPLESPTLPAPTVAERVTRYGRWLVYSLDNNTHMETGGFWCAADRTARIVVADVSGRSHDYTLALEAGPTPVRVRMTAVNLYRDFTLAAGEKARVVIPATNASDPLRIDIEGGFQAASAFGNPADRRQLGVWMSIDETEF